MPVFSTNIMSVGVATAVDNDTHDNENLEKCEQRVASRNTETATYNNGNDFEQTQPVFELF